MNDPTRADISGSNHPSTTGGKKRNHRVEFWLSDTPYDMLHDIAKFEDRSMSTILKRALAVYAKSYYIREE